MANLFKDFLAVLGFPRKPKKSVNASVKSAAVGAPRVVLQGPTTSRGRSRSTQSEGGSINGPNLLATAIVVNSIVSSATSTSCSSRIDGGSVGSDSSSSGGDCGGGGD